MRENLSGRSCTLKLKKLAFLTIVFFIWCLDSIVAQNPAYQDPYNQNPVYQDTLIEEDTTTYTKPINLAKLDSAYHSPSKAAIFSAVVPGLGQIYNKKYWKVPIIYGSFVAFGFLIDRNQKEYVIWRRAYVDYDSGFNIPGVSTQLTREQVNDGKNFYKRQKELSIIATVGFYVLQILDASVDAHLFDWNVGEDISLNAEPFIVSPLPFVSSIGISACICF